MCVGLPPSHPPSPTTVMCTLSALDSLDAAVAGEASDVDVARDWSPTRNLATGDVQTRDIHIYYLYSPKYTPTHTHTRIHTHTHTHTHAHAHIHTYTHTHTHTHSYTYTQGTFIDKVPLWATPCYAGNRLYYLPLKT